MRTFSVARLCAMAAIAGGVIVSASQLPDEPPKQFGSSVTGAFEGWFDNADGSRTFALGYLNRNRQREVDIPIGPNNHIDPGGPDMGQPTHFLPGRQTGIFTVTVPKSFPIASRLTWTLTMNGETNTIPFTLKPAYNFSPFKDEAVGNTPPVLCSRKARPASRGRSPQSRRRRWRKARPSARRSSSPCGRTTTRSTRA